MEAAPPSGQAQCEEGPSPRQEIGEEGPKEHQQEVQEAEEQHQEAPPQDQGLLRWDPERHPEGEVRHAQGQLHLEDDQEHPHIHSQLPRSAEPQVGGGQNELLYHVNIEFKSPSQ